MQHKLLDSMFVVFITFSRRSQNYLKDRALFPERTMIEWLEASLPIQLETYNYIYKRLCWNGIMCLHSQYSGV